MGVGEISDCV